MRPIESRTAVIRPGKAFGKTTLKIVCVLLAPSARLADKYSLGTTLIASDAVLTIIGSKIIVIVRAPAKIEKTFLPDIVPTKGINTIIPTKPKIILGTPLVASIIFIIIVLNLPSFA